MVAARAAARRGGVSGDPVDVPVVGAGPSRPALALPARACGARLRIVEHRQALFRLSRAMIMHPGTREARR